MRTRTERRRKRVYISGAITGHDLRERMTEFERVEGFLRMLGYEPVNPMRNGLPETATREQHMKRDMAMLATCDRIFMLKGWEKSEGAKLELMVATACGMKVIIDTNFRF